jgi:GT2 family glycosyltransferase
MKPDVSIILLNYNGKQFNKACIQSLLTQSYQNFEIIFTDNASQDGSVEEVEHIFSKEIEQIKIKIVRNKINYGFAEGNNKGIVHAHSNSIYICLLNNDTIVEKDWLKELIVGIQSDPKLGVVGSLVLDK